MTDAPVVSADVFVVGHATIDLERVPGHADVERPGGAVLYAATASARLGAHTVALTRAPLRWAVRGLEAAAEAGAELVVRPSAEVTRFELVHEHAGIEAARRLRLTSVAAPFLAEDLRTVKARAIVLAPLTAQDFDPAVVAEARARAQILAIGAQGLLRRVDEAGQVHPAMPVEMTWLDAVDVIACDAAEAAALTGHPDPGVAARALADRRAGLDVIVTAGARGAWVHADGIAHHQPAIVPRAFVSSTGAGDTFLAAWLVARLDGRDVLDAARFAAAAASLSLEHGGPLRADLAQTLARAATALRPTAASPSSST